VTAGPALAAEALSAARGFALPWEGLRLLLRERRLWAPAAVPLLLSALAVAAAATAVLACAGPIHAWTSAWLPSVEPGAWYSWLWVGPLKALCFVLDKLLFAAVAVLALAASFVLASALASPFHDALARRVEELVLGRAGSPQAPRPAGWLRDAARALGEELRRLASFGALWLAIAAAGLLLPGGQLLAGPALLALSMLFLTLDFAGYALDRRRASFAEKRRWLRRHLGAALGFGSAALLACAMPGLNLLALPVLVVSGTLLALRTLGELRDRGAGAGSSRSP
jgi:CysZ protein